jgi:PAS domain-containing protein
MEITQEAAQKLLESYEELDAAYEELMADEKELKPQGDELQKNQRALYISEQHYKLAVEGANDGIGDWDIENNNLFLSPKLKKI